MIQCGTEPPRLPPERIHGEGNGSFRSVPSTVQIAGHYPECVQLRSEIGVTRLRSRDRLAPTGIVAVEPPLESDQFRSGQDQAGESKLDPAASCWNAKPPY